MSFDITTDYILQRSPVRPDHKLSGRITEGSAYEYIDIDENTIQCYDNYWSDPNTRLPFRDYDITISVGKVTFEAHKHVLSQASSYFSAMFARKSYRKHDRIVDLSNIKESALKNTLDYIYQGFIILDGENIESTLEAARFFQVPQILPMCVHYIQSHINLDNFSHMFELADLYSLEKLIPQIFRFAGANLSDLSENPGFIESLTFDLLTQFLSHNVYVDISEGCVLKLVLDWMSESPNFCDEYALPVLSCIRYPMLHLIELETLPVQIVQIPELETDIINASEHIQNLNIQSLHSSEKFCPRGSKRVVTIISSTPEYNGDIILYRDPDKNGFCLEQIHSSYQGKFDRRNPARPRQPGGHNLDVILEGTCQAVLGNHVYVVGGYDELGSSSDRVFRFDPRYRDWIEFSGMNQCRVSCAICSNDKVLFVTGGVSHMADADVVLDSTEVYNPVTDSWEYFTPLRKGLFDHAAAAIGDTIYISGGMHSMLLNEPPSNSLLCHKLGENSWTELAPMSVGRYCHAMTIIRDKLYVVGGLTTCSTDCAEPCGVNEVYDPGTGQWTRLSDTPPEFGLLSRYTAYISPTLYMLGCVDGDQYLHEYDVNTDEFRRGAMVGPMFTRLAALKVALP